MLILVGISIASLTGNRFFEKAKLAKEKQENEQIKKNATLGGYEIEINSLLGTRDIDMSTIEEIINKGKKIQNNFLL